MSHNLSLVCGLFFLLEKLCCYGKKTVQVEKPVLFAQVMLPYHPGHLASACFTEHSAVKIQEKKKSKKDKEKKEKENANHLKILKEKLFKILIVSLVLNGHITTKFLWTGIKYKNL